MKPTYGMKRLFAALIAMTCAPQINAASIPYGDGDVRDDALTGSNTLEVAADAAAVQNGPISGTGTQTKTGQGTLTLGGDNSAFTGSWTISSGRLDIAAREHLGSSLSKIKFTSSKSDTAGLSDLESSLLTTVNGYLADPSAANSPDQALAGFHALDDGGTIATLGVLKDSTVTMTGSTGDRLVMAGGQTGRFLLEDGASLTFTSYVYQSGSSTRDGAVFYINDGAVLLMQAAEGAKYTIRNTSGYNGALYNKGLLSIANAEFNNNTATQYGAAIYNGGGLTLIDNSVFTNNKAGQAGAIHNNAGAMVITNSRFENNEATSYSGGAIYNKGSLLIRDTDFIGNKASSGGAIYSSSDLTIEVSDDRTSLMSGNVAKAMFWGNDETSGINFSTKLTVNTGRNAVFDMRDSLYGQATFNPISVVVNGEGTWKIGGEAKLTGYDNTIFTINSGTVYLYRAGEVSNANGSDASAMVEAGSIVLDGSTAGSSFDLKSGATLAFGGGNTIEMTMSTTKLNFDGGSILSFDVANNVGASAPVVTIDARSFTLDPGVIVNLHTWADGTCHLARSLYANFGVSELALTVDGVAYDSANIRQTIELVFTDNRNLYVTGTTDRNVVLAWNGLADSSWNAAGNWTNGFDGDFAANTFRQGDHVVFDAEDNHTVDIDGTVLPSGMAISGEGSWTFTGDGAIVLDSSTATTLNDAAQTLVKDGAGSAIFRNGTDDAPNTFGGIDVRGGRIELHSHAVITGDASIADGAELVLNRDGITFEGKLDNHGAVRFGNLGHTLYVNELTGSDGDWHLEVDMQGGQTDSIRVAATASGSHRLYITDLSADPNAIDPQQYRPVFVSALASSTADITGSFTAGIWEYNVIPIASADGTRTEWVADTADVDLSPVGGAIINTAGAMSAGWFSQLDSLHKRMGELRLTGQVVRDAKSGDIARAVNQDDLWFRAYGQQTNTDLDIAGLDNLREYLFGSDFGFDRATTLQGGGMLMGGLFGGYQRSEREFRDEFNSKGNTDSVYWGAYGTWSGTSGWYVDVVNKWQVFDSEYKTKGPQPDKGGYNTWGVGLSVETGRNFRLAQGWFVEPSAQIAYLYLVGKNYTTANGIDVENGGAGTWQFAATVRAGKTFAVNGSASVWQPYVKAGVVEQVSGNGHVRTGGHSWRPNTDGTRGVAGAGAIWQMGVRDQIHIDYEASIGDKVTVPWNVNLGYRRSF